MNLPSELMIAIDSEIKNLNRKDLICDAKAISDRYRFESGTSKSLLTTDSEALAYVISRMPATYSAVHSAVSTVSNLISDRTLTLLDVGAGTGAATFAISQQTNLKEITCLERENVMIDLGKRLMQGTDALKNVNWVKFDLLSQEINRQADLVVASYVLSELSKIERQKLLKQLWNATNELLIIVEPGTPKAYKEIQNSRELLLGLGAYMVAPCPHSNTCPLTENDWCHFSCRVQRSAAHKQLKSGTAPYEDEKFTYLIVSKNKTLPEDNRILRHPQVRSKLVMLEMCTQKGLKNLTVTKSEGEKYKHARKLSAGDILK